LLDLPADPDDQGRNLSTTLVDVSSDAVDRQSPPIIFLRNSGTSARWVAAIDARYKLILSVSDDPWLFDNEQDPDELLNFYGRPGTKGVAQRLAKALREYGARVKDPYFEHQQIIVSLARVLGEPVPDDQANSQGYKSKWKGSRRWIGPDWWANPLTDWMLRNDAVTVVAAADLSDGSASAEVDGRRWQASGLSRIGHVKVLRHGPVYRRQYRTPGRAAPPDGAA
jgi:hypothetical protein